MGLDATVMCRCLQDGLAVPEPFRARLVVDEDGEPALDIDFRESRDLYRQLDPWLDACRPRAGMNLVRRRIGSRHGVRPFQEASRNAGDGGLFGAACAASMSMGNPVRWR